MIVTRIEELSGSRKRVWIDDSIAFVLYKGELRLYEIAEGEEIREAVFREITEQLLVKRAKLRCMNLLKARPYTEAGLRQKLKQGGYLPEAADAALDYVKSCGYVDDLAYAQEFIRCYAPSRSRRRIQEDLQQKGVSREVIAQAFENAEELGESVDETGLALALLAKRKYDPEKADYQERQKTAAFLFRKGIPGDIIRQVLRG